jgi:uncharacterized integral membrane protein (TIGR00698 family)
MDATRLNGLQSDITRLRGVLPGAGLAIMIAMAATFVSQLHGGPQLLYALFFGTAFHYLSSEPRTQPGIEFCARDVLRLGVGLLGARITVAQIAALGWTTAAIVVTAVVSTFFLGVMLARRLGMSRAQGALSGGAVAICGASAALAIAAVLPKEKDHDRNTLMVVVSVTVMSTLAMILYPLLVKAIALSPPSAGLFIGGTIHDVAQVVGAGYMLGHDTGDVATIVKLFRVAMLTVVVVGVSAAFKRERDALSAPATAVGICPSPPAVRPASLVPWFLWLFVAMVALNSAGALSPGVQLLCNSVSRSCLVVAIAALGAKTSFQDLAKAGWRPIVLILAETVWMAGLVLTCILLMQR